jgi:hypothetical protein
MVPAYRKYFRNTAPVGWFQLASPFPCYYVLLLYGVIAWPQVGHFPYYGHPDPKDMGLGVVHLFVSLFCMAGAGVGLLGNMAAVPLMLLGRPGEKNAPSLPLRGDAH